MQALTKQEIEDLADKVDQWREIRQAAGRMTPGLDVALTRVKLDLWAAAHNYAPPPTLAGDLDRLGNALANER